MLGGVFLALPGKAGEAGVTHTFQILSGLGEATLLVEKVYCYDHYAHSGCPTAFGLIAKPNIPPHNAPEPIPDMNAVSASGLVIKIWESSDAASRHHLIVDAKALRIPTRFGTSETELLRATLEAIRRTAELIKLTNYHVTVRGHETADALTKQFAQHPKKKAFWSP